MPPAPSPSRPVETRFIALVFLGALAFNAWGVSHGWKHANLAGHEFRQTQTAVSILFIRQEHNYSLAYPTPILGKPWSVPFEFPLYQWTVAALGEATGLSVTAAGRLVSVACFYLALPALYLLLRRLGLAPAHRLIALSFVVLCPLYILYERAVLIETMALMFGCWYAALLPLAFERRRMGWIILLNLAGMGAGLVKVTTFLVFLLPAFFWSLRQLWLSRPSRHARDWRPLLRTLGWLAAAHAAAFAATLWWVRFADGHKALNVSARDLQSAGLVSWNFATGHRFDAALWTAIGRTVAREVAPPLALLAGGLLTALVARRRAWPIAALAVWWGVVLATFPLLYALHDYYHVAAAFLPMLALGLATAAAFESGRLPRFLALGLWAALLAVQARAFLENVYPIYREAGNGGGLAAALKEVLQPEEVMVVAGDDWSSILPFFAERRALMIRNGRQNEPDYLRSAFAGLRGETVGALVLYEDQDQNAPLRQLAQETFGLGPLPLLRWHHGGRRATVYLNRQIQPDVLMAMERNHGFADVQVAAESLPVENPLAAHELAYAGLLPRHQRLFRIVNPRPVRFYSYFRPELWNAGQAGHERLSAHPDTKLWFALPPGRHRLHTDIDIVPGAWENVKPADASDGVGLAVAAFFPGGRREILQRRHINPAANPADRGVQAIDWSFELPEGAELELSVDAGPTGNGARDWSSLGPITIE